MVDNTYDELIDDLPKKNSESIELVEARELVREKEEAIIKLLKIIEDKDALIAEKDALIAKKVALIAKKEVLIAKIEALLTAFEKYDKDCNHFDSK